MKRVLITGAGSYIGTSFDRYLKENYPDKYEVDTVDMEVGGKNRSVVMIRCFMSQASHIRTTEKSAKKWELSGNEYPCCMSVLFS